MKWFHHLGIGQGPRLGALVAIVAMVSGCVALDQRGIQELERAYGANPPKIEASFASRIVAAGDTWRVYIRGSDPDGDLRFLNVSLWMATAVMTPIRLEVSPEHSRAISGYITLDTNRFSGGFLRLTPGEIRLYVALEDRAGHRSDLSVHDTSLILGAKQERPAPGAFEERYLGSVPLEFLMQGGMGASPSWP